MSGFLVVDIETVRDPKVPHKEEKTKLWLQERFDDRAEAWEHARIMERDLFPSPACHEVKVIGGCVLDDEYQPKSLACFRKPTTERELLDCFLNFIEKTSPTLVTWNGRGFDLPVIMTRAMKYGFQCPLWFGNRDNRYRYSDRGHIDVMDVISDFGAAQKIHLEQAAKMIGLPGKPDGVDGGSVEDMIAASEDGIYRVREYCLSDVLQTTVIFLRRKLLQGDVTLARYQSAIAKLRDLIATAELPAGWCLKLDWDVIGLVST